MITHASSTSTDPLSPAAEQLQRLRERESAWASLSIAHTHVVTMEGLRSALTFSGKGIITAVVGSDIRVPTPAGNSVALAALKTCISPRPWIGADEPEYKSFPLHDILAKNVVAFVTDPTQNLLIVLVYGQRGASLPGWE
ncbi:unnamed protein product [Peniophora sp. CBMAI 1063]|nr:unnamed protein product [Peniophora sp. CBMAI 1063]